MSHNPGSLLRKLCYETYSFYLENVDTQHSAAWQGERGHNSHIVFKRIFFSKTNLKLIEKQKKFLGVWGHAYLENF